MKNDNTLLLKQSDISEAIDDLIRKRDLARPGGYSVQFRAMKESLESQATLRSC